MAYILINPDNTLNWIGDVWNESLILENVEIVTVKEKTSKDLLGQIDFLNAAWDKNNNKVVSISENPEIVTLN